MLVKGRNPLGELVGNLLETSFQLVSCCKSDFFYVPLVQQVANLHVVIDLSGANLLATQKSCELVAS